MMNAKICTDIEQSKKLIELGVDPETADMYWNASSDNGENYAEFPTCELATQWDIPAWSLPALLNLMSYTNIVVRKDYCKVENVNKTIKDSSLVDATFELFCWLKEKK